MLARAFVQEVKVGSEHPLFRSRTHKECSIGLQRQCQKLDCTLGVRRDKRTGQTESGNIRRGIPEKSRLSGAAATKMEESSRIVEGVFSSSVPSRSLGRQDRDRIARSIDDSGFPSRGTHIKPLPIKGMLSGLLRSAKCASSQELRLISAMEARGLPCVFLLQSC
jgi:hypothetical protein